MKKEKPRNMDVDELLKDILDDHLPAEAERRMQSRMAEFRTRIEEPGRRRETSLTRFWQGLFMAKNRPAAVRWIFNKQALALISVFMLAVGGFLQATGHPSALAESLVSLRTSVSVADTIRRSGAMECKVRVAEKEGGPSDYIIRWIQPGIGRVDVQRAAAVRETLWITNGDLVVVDHLKNTSQKFARLEQLRDSLFRPVLAFLSPTALAENLDQRWKLERFGQETGGHEGILIFTDKEKGSRLEMIVDLSSYLPTRISRLRPSAEKGGPAEELMRFDFTWNRPDSSQEGTFPEAAGKNGRA